MKLGLNINGIEEVLELLAPAPACRFRLGEGAGREAEVEVPEPGVYSVLMGGRSYDARIEEHPDCLVVFVDGYRFRIEARDPRRWTSKAGHGVAEGVQVVTAPMPGKVVRVLVAPGDAVESGQGLLVVEAMKMQNEIKAQRAGRVLAVNVKEGATVAAGEVLAALE
jgi:biotin carboxyl carrier protein